MIDLQKAFSLEKYFDKTHNVIDCLNNNKEALENNKLEDFYNNDTEFLDVWEQYFLGGFLESCGIKFEDYFKAVPNYFCYMPFSWVHGDTLVVPPNITKLGEFCFGGLSDIKKYGSLPVPDVSVLDISHITSVGSGIIDNPTQFNTIKFGPNLQYLDEEWGNGAHSLTLALVPKNIYNDMDIMLLIDPYVTKIKVY